MKLFKSLLVAPATLGLLAPFSVSANEVNLNDISNYSDVESFEFANSFETEEPTQSTLLAGGEGLVESYDGSFSTTTTASFSADFVIGAVDGGAAGSEATTFDYQYGMSLSTSFTGEDSLDLTIETGNGNSASATILDMNSMGDAMILDGITYTFPLGDALTVMVGDSTDVSALYSTACTYSAFTDLISNCGSGTAAGLGGGSVPNANASTSDDGSSATFAAAYDFGNGLTVAGGLSAVGGETEGLFTKESLDVYGVQVAYNTDSLGVSFSYALTETSTTADTTFFGVNAYYSLDGGPSLSVGYEIEDPDATAEETGYFIGLTWDDFGPGSFSIGMSTLENYTDAQSELYQYEAAYSYAVNDGMTITPGIFIKEVANADDETGVIVKTSFSF